MGKQEREKFWDELTKADDIYFRNSGASDPSSLTVLGSRRLQILPPTELLTADKFIERVYNHEGINKYLDMLRPKDANIMICLPSAILEENKDLMRGETRVERFTRNKYWRFPNYLVNKLEARRKKGATAGIPRNPYIPHIQNGIEVVDLMEDQLLRKLIILGDFGGMNSKFL